ncbi:Jasmonate-zim-domain protein 6, putative isoform 2 [Hibiscus syriacus]|uniref:Protein TIFY n=1 Tax=Hibiscus syriacus TaxID=106335 RepID=A0A6A2Y468_HIBSY|nr:protein TIFY 10B-like [Hibiscus syriacus]KAE8667139.1 Jasmonate-zim-domain protein 6, putative isoform 2 [Hibiscus syriacus]
MSNLGQKSHERASFVNLLSQYLKEKRNLGDFSVGISSKPDAKGQQAKTINFLSHVANSSESSRPNLVASTSNVKSSDFIPFGSSSSKEDAIDKTDLRKLVAVEPKNAQLTMFFNGQVFVYNDFPADKVKEIMTLANQGSSTACSGVNVAVSAMEKPSHKINKTDNNSDIPDLNIASGTANTLAQDPSVERHQYGGSDLRIARRNSLHKFFEKRKDRAAARAPYQLNNNRVSPPPPKRGGNKAADYEEGESSKETSRNIDLNL